MLFHASRSLPYSAGNTFFFLKASFCDAQASSRQHYRNINLKGHTSHRAQSERSLYIRAVGEIFYDRLISLEYLENGNQATVFPKTCGNKLTFAERLRHMAGQSRIIATMMEWVDESFDVNAIISGNNLPDAKCLHKNGLPCPRVVLRSVLLAWNAALVRQPQIAVRLLFDLVGRTHGTNSCSGMDILHATPLIIFWNNMMVSKLKEQEANDKT